MERVCFVISPMGDDNSPVRSRADYVLKTYIEPACQMAGYQAVRADQGVGLDIVRGVNTALQNAPMCIASMGSTPECSTASCSGSAFWNGNVMIEVGYRLASRLPLIFLCDRDSGGKPPELPMSLRNLNVIILPANSLGGKWVDPNPMNSVEKIVKQLQEEGRRRRPLDSMLALVAINASARETQKPENLYYTATSEIAEDMFGVRDGDDERRLVGRSMVQFLEGVKQRMHPVQWRKFEEDQTNARRRLRRRASGDQGKPSAASIPIVFQSNDDDEDDDYTNRAFLPIIVQDFRPGDSDWYNLRVAYLNVTSVTTKEVQDGEEFYVCHLDPTSDLRLEPLKQPEPRIKAVISYTTRNQSYAEGVHEILVGLQPYVDNFIDSAILPGSDWVDTLAKAFSEADVCFLLLDSKPMGEGQATEVRELQARLMSSSARPCRIIPVLIGEKGSPPPTLPPVISTIEWVCYDKLDAVLVRRILSTQFPDRCPREWVVSTAKL